MLSAHLLTCFINIYPVLAYYTPDLVLRKKGRPNIMINLINASMGVNSTCFLEHMESGQTQKGRVGGGVSSDTNQGALNINNLKRISPCKCKF